MVIKIYKASNFSFTPFNNYVDGDLDFLRANGLEIVTSPIKANIIISQNFKHLKKHFWRGFFGKNFLVWTLEPRFDAHFVKEKRVFFSFFKCHFMNVYTKDVYVTNLSIVCNYIDKKLKLIPNNFKLKNKKIIALMSHFKGVNSPPLFRNGINIDLIGLRTKIALSGKHREVLDIYGKGWANNISNEDSREGNWMLRKRELMNNYTFNLCFENTVAKNYMTEKIWDSIETYCLPIYFGNGTNAYDIFPENSFIDYSSFSSPEDLFSFIETISDKEYIKRMNKCIIIYNTISDDNKSISKIEREKMLSCIIEKVKFIVRH